LAFHKPFNENSGGDALPRDRQKKSIISGFHVCQNRTFFGLSTYMTKGDKNVKLGIKDRTLVLYAVQIIFFKKGI
jgi:hypothetical protein